ncbi:DUF6302 family protein [Streptomyces sp. NBC_00996]|uniref:DUF6302 family protein n=1 Tax=Streptomyces sp. NBC_00996 TaxID=2903710 RepID=UPI003864E1DF|nr:DUF6302 family protein [Streptomyces sp. NBC_00996]
MAPFDEDAGSIRIVAACTAGACRRGRRPNWREALITILQLEAHTDQFPNVRQRKPVGAPCEPRTVCWGMPTPADDRTTRGRLFGYHEADIAAYGAEHSHLATTSTQD